MNYFKIGPDAIRRLMAAERNRKRARDLLIKFKESERAEEVEWLDPAIEDEFVKAKII